MLTLYHDLTSPAAAVAVLRLQVLADAGAAVEFVGIDMLGLAVGVPATLDQFEELERMQDRARELGLVMHRPQRRPPTLDAHLVGQRATRLGLGASWRLACLRAYFTDRADLASHATLRALGVAAGLAEADVDAVLADDLERRALRARMTTIRRRGIGAVPVLEAGPGNLVSADLSDADLAALASL